MSDTVWRYENYGTADLFPAVGGTNFTDLPVEQSKTGYAFYRPAKYPLEFVEVASSYEIWLKWDFYIVPGAIPYRDFIRVYVYANKVIGFSNNFANEPRDKFEVTLELGGDVAYTGIYLEPGTLYTARLHIISRATNGLIALDIGGESYSFTGNVPFTNPGKAITGMTIIMERSNILASNIIFSNSEIALDEVVSTSIDTGEVDLEYDLQRNVKITGIITADAQRYLYLLNKGLTFDLRRTVIASGADKIDVIRQLPNHLIIMPVKDGVLYGRSSTVGVREVEINIGAQQLTDQVDFTAIWDVQIMEKIIGQYLDYHYDLRVERLQRNGITATCHCCSDVDEILYTQIAYTFTAAEIAKSYWHTNDSGSSSSSTNKKTHPKGKGVPGTTYKVISYPQQPTTAQADKIPKGFASMHAEKIAKALTKELVCQIDDFVSTVDVNQGGATFSDLIGDIFGWTSRIPTLLINCYLNDNKLYIIQRGYESNIIDISDTKHTVPVITQELVRTFWHGRKTYRTETRSVAYWEWVPDEDSDSDADDDDDDTEPSDPDIDIPADQKFEFDKDGLVKKSYRIETVRNADGTTTIIEVETDYDYITLRNGRKFLHKETTRNYIDQELIDENIVEHTPLDQGQSHTYAKDEEGYYLGSTVGRGKRDDRISKRNKVELPNDDTADLNENEEDDNWQNTKTESQSRTIPGIVNFDTSFPVYGNEKLKAITEEIKRLNRKTKETVAVEIYNYNHVININDRIIFHGHTYFFESNTVVKTPRIVNKQTLTMVRWF